MFSIWFAYFPERVSAIARIALSNPDSALMYSPVAIVEFAIKSNAGGITFDLPVAEWITNAAAELEAAELPFTARHAAVLDGLPLHHRDPFDRMLIAQAIVEGAKLVTADRTFSNYPVPTVW